MVTFTAKSFKKIMSFQGAVFGVLLLGAIWKLVLLAGHAFPFNADEAIVGLMGRHILSGANPIFFYGQAYMGSLDAYLVTIGFRLFGSEVWVIRSVQIILFLGFVATTILIALHLHKDKIAALVSGLLLAIPTVNFTLYTTVSLGGYGEALLIGNLLILLTLKLQEEPRARGKYVLWGSLAGLGFWAFGLTVIYIVPCGIALILSLARQGENVKRWRNLYLLALGAALGLSPVGLWVAQNGSGELIREFFGSAIAGTSSANFWNSIIIHLKNFLIFGPTVILGFRAPWATDPLALPLLPLAASFWFAVCVHAVFRRQRPQGLALLSLVGASSLVLLSGFMFTPFGADPSGRYFLPLMLPLVLLAGEFVRKPMVPLHRSIRWILVAGTLAFNGFSTWQVASKQPERLTTQFDSDARVDHSHMEALIQFLNSHGETRGYTNYWVSYPLAFQSDEQLIFYPALPYHQDLRYTARDNRYPEYQVLIEQSPKVAFITTNHPALNDALRESLKTLKVTWDEAIIGDYLIIYDLSERVDIEAVGERWLEPGI
ncbi:MAG: hypothetical protein E4G99_06995 [Anaerolineales bacterium]|nr:MAG: hypothetical protein E4G99_06995 [Anaerolineales bacterium]